MGLIRGANRQKQGNSGSAKYGWYKIFDAVPDETRLSPSTELWNQSCASVTWLSVICYYYWVPKTGILHSSIDWLKYLIKVTYWSDWLRNTNCDLIGWLNGQEGAYLCMYWAASWDNSSYSLSCEWDVAQQHSSMDGEVIHTLHHTVSPVIMTVPRPWAQAKEATADLCCECAAESIKWQDWSVQ